VATGCISFTGHCNSDALPGCESTCVEDGIAAIEELKRNPHYGLLACDMFFEDLPQERLIGQDGHLEGVAIFSFTLFVQKNAKK